MLTGTQVKSNNSRVQHLLKEFDTYFHFDLSDFDNAGFIKYRVRSDDYGSQLFNYRDFSDFFRHSSLGYTPSNYVALLIPCNSFKPEILCQTHFMTLRNLRDKGYLRRLDVWVVAEPVGIYSYRDVFRYPAANYDFPPKFAGKKTRAMLKKRMIEWLTIVGRKYEIIICFLTHYHRELVRDSLRKVKIPGKVLLIVNSARLHSRQEQLKLIRRLSSVFGR